MMRAKMVVTSVTKHEGFTQEDVALACVSEKPYGPGGESEDNTFALYTPSGDASLVISNPALHGKIVPGMKFYVDFTEAPE